MKIEKSEATNLRTEVEFPVSSFRALENCYSSMLELSFSQHKKLRSDESERCFYFHSSGFIFRKTYIRIV